MHHDLFVLNAEHDEPWVLGYLIPGLGLSVERVVTQADFQLGIPILKEFERCVRDSRFVLLVLSNAFMADKWANYVEQIASFLTVVEQRARVIPLLLEDCGLPPRIDFLVRLDCRQPTAWSEELRRLRLALNSAEPEPNKVACPYIGMVSFSSSDAGYFYGREAEIDQIVQLFRYKRLLFIIGPSGVGKSSLVFAGLIPALMGIGAPFAPNFWCFRDFRPGNKPLEKLRTALGGDLHDPGKDLVNVLAAQKPAQRVLIFIDQFEEIFAQCGKDDQASFFAAMQALHGEQSCAFVCTMRANFYVDLMRSEIWDAVKDHRFDLAPPRGKALRDAIEGPAKKMKVFLDPRLVDQLLRDAASEPGVLPLMQEAMILLWSKLEHRYLPISTYEQLGRDDRSGLAVAVANKAEATLSELNQKEEVIARRIFLRLIQFGEGRPDTRRQQRVEDLRNAADDAPAFERTLNHLINSNLLTISGVHTEGQTAAVSSVGEGAKVDIAHEALIAGWPKLQGWIAARRQAEQIRRRLEGNASDWAERKREGRPGGFLDETELLEAERWRNSEDGVALGSSDELVSLMAESREHLETIAKDKEAARQRELNQARSFVRKLFLISSALCIALLLAIAGIFVAGNQVILSNVRRLAAQGTSKLNVRPDQALLLSVAASSSDRKPRFMESLRAGFSQFAGMIMGRDSAKSRAVESSLLAGIQHTGYVLAFLHGNDGFAWDLAVSPDGKAVAAACADGTITVWSLDTYEVLRTLPTESKQLYSVAFSPDGKLLAATGAAEKIFLWNATSWKPLASPIVNPDGAARALSFSPDGKLLAWSNGVDNTITVWNIEAHCPTDHPLKGHINIVDCLSFSPDGLLLATGSRDTRAALWNVRTGQRVGAWLDYHSGAIYGVAFSPDGNRLATASADHEITIWDVATQTQLGTALTGHSSGVWQVKFSPDGTKLASCGTDATVRLWNVQTGLQIGSAFTGHRGQVHTITFTPDSKRLISAGWDHSVIVWNIAQRYPLAHVVAKTSAPIIKVAQRRDQKVPVAVDSRGFVALGQSNGAASTFELFRSQPTESYWTVAASPDGKMLATGGSAGIITLWDCGSRRPVDKFGSSSGGINSVAFSPAGDVIASASDNGEIILWDVATRTPIGDPLVGHFRTINALAFSPDGKTLYSAGDDYSVIRWDIKTHAFSRYVGFSNIVLRIALTPNGNTLVSVSLDGSVKFWNTATNQLISDQSFLSDTMEPFDDYTVACSPDGKIVAVSGGDQIAFWELKSQKRIRKIFHSEEDEIKDLKFSPDGKTLAAARQGKAIDLWDVKTGAVTRLEKAHSGTVSCVAFFKDGGTLASASFDNTVVFWNVSKGQPEGEPLHGDNKTISAADLSPDGKILATGHQDGTISLWNLESRRQINVGFKAHEKQILCLAFSPDGQKLASSGSDDGEVKIWDIASDGKFVSWNAHQGTVRVIAFSPDSQTLATADMGSEIRLWNVKTMSAVGQSLRGHDDWVAALAFSPDGKILASGGRDRRVLLWDVAKQHRIGTPLLFHTGTVFSLAFSPNGRTLASGGNDMEIVLWDINSQEPIGQGFYTAGEVDSLAFSDDGKSLYSGGSDKLLTTWDLDTNHWIKIANGVANRKLTPGETE